MKMLKPQLVNKAKLIKFDEGPDGASAMLSLDENENFEITWHGDHKPGRVIATYDEGFLSFFTGGMHFAGLTANSTTIHPKAILSAHQRELVASEIFDNLRVSYNNIFTNFHYDHNKLRPIDVLALVNKKPIIIGDGIELTIFIGSQSHLTTFPTSVSHTLDDLNFYFTGKRKIKFSEAHRYIEITTKLIALYLKKPIDPKLIEFGLSSKQHEGIYDYAQLEYSGVHEYANLQRDFNYAIDIQQHAESMANALQGAFKIDVQSEINLWYSFTESDYKRHYLDTIMSILLSCAESTYYLLPQLDISKREREFDDFLKQIQEIEITPVKLSRFIRNAKDAYTSPVTYETKILSLIKYADVTIDDKELVAKFLNQLRNNLMHGTKPDWTHIVDKDRKPIKLIDPLKILEQLKLIVTKSLIKHLENNV